MIRKLTTTDIQAILTVVNDAAIAYKGKIPADRWKEPYMPMQELKEEIKSGVQFYGTIENGKLIAVMGIQPVKDVTLIRHAYTLTSQQRKRVGEKLLRHLLGLAKTDRVLVGTWETAPWAIKFYQKHGFVLLSREETNNLLKKYWNLPERQIETSVVLEYKRQPK
ncbi:MAG: GNAT family N-acetyltransferase [Chloroflexi bacterium]|nr:GNAT family N-acetyltransferase [Chloroflexota bacterium]MCL5949854.1 GNAT family N-acetyltransferase [Candidatus Bathyarchaeota archaeon]